MEGQLKQEPFRVLSLDGGGAKGFYTLGVLREVEALVGRPLHKCFDLIFGTSTGSIIASLLGLGFSVGDIHDLYKDHVVKVMRTRTAAAKSSALRSLAEEVFRDRKFDEFKTGIGIVATKWQLEIPMVFKSRPTQAHGRAATFTPGFGCRIGEAVQASCSAYPFFERQRVTTSSGDTVELVDGGYCANNPTLYAIADAARACNLSYDRIRVLSLGVGNYPEPKAPLWMGLAKKHLLSVQLLQKTLEINTASMEQLRSVLFGHVPTIRISDSFTQPEMATDMFEHNLDKLNVLAQRGAESFGRREAEVSNLIGEFV